MKPYKFSEECIEIAKDQDEYLNLPAHVDEEGIVTTAWEPSNDEIEEIKRGGSIWIQIMTFNKGLQPLKVQVGMPRIKYNEDDSGVKKED